MARAKKKSLQKVSSHAALKIRLEKKFAEARPEVWQDEGAKNCEVVYYMELSYAEYQLLSGMLRYAVFGWGR